MSHKSERHPSPSSREQFKTFTGDTLRQAGTRVIREVEEIGNTAVGAGIDAARDAYKAERANARAALGDAGLLDTIRAELSVVRSLPDIAGAGLEAINNTRENEVSSRIGGLKTEARKEIKKISRSVVSGIDRLLRS